MRKTKLVDSIFKDLDGSLSKNQILSVLHLAESYGMKPPGYIGNVDCIGSYVENEWGA